MKITKEDLKVRFDEYNRMYFDGKLENLKLTKIAVLRIEPLRSVKESLEMKKRLRIMAFQPCSLSTNW